MNDLEKILAEKLGIPLERAHQAILLTVDYLRTKLPAPVFSDIELVLEMPEVKAEEAAELGLFRIP